MSEKSYQKNSDVILNRAKDYDVILNRAKDYYGNDKERLREQARCKYRNLSEEEKNKEKNMEKTDTIICLKKRNKN